MSKREKSVGLPRSPQRLLPLPKSAWASLGKSRRIRNIRPPLRLTHRGSLRSPLARWDLCWTNEHKPMSEAPSAPRFRSKQRASRPSRKQLVNLRFIAQVPPAQTQHTSTSGHTQRSVTNAHRVAAISGPVHSDVALASLDRITVSAIPAD